MKEQTGIFTEAERKLYYVENVVRTRPVFWQEPLTMYCGIPILDLGGEGDGRLDLLICKEKKILLAVEITGPGKERKKEGLKGFPVLGIPVQQAGKKTEMLLESYLKKLLEKPGIIDAGYLPRPIGKELRQEFAKERMLEQAANGIWQPTEYGTSFGLIKGYVGMEQKLFYSERAKERILEIREWKRQPEGKWRVKRIPFAKRLERLSTSVLTCNGDSVRRLQEFMVLPLDIYMEKFPDELHQLKNRLRIPAKQGEKITCMQAIRRADDFLRSVKERENGRRIMQLLAVPMVYEHERRKGRNGSDENAP